MVKHVTVQFRDYSPQELEEVFRNMISAGRHPYELEPEAEAALHNFFKRMVNMKMKDFANARTVRTTVENAIKRHRSRLQEEKAEGKDTSAYTYTLSRLDIEGEEALEHKTVEEVMEELDEFVGMESVKKAIRELADDEFRSALTHAFSIASRPRDIGEPLDWKDTLLPSAWRFSDGEQSYSWFGDASGKDGR